MSIRSPRLSRSSTTFSRQGFFPLEPKKTTAMSSNIDGNIPLSRIETHSSSSGARKPGEGALNGSTKQSSFENEKKAWSGRRIVQKPHNRKLRINTDGDEIEVNRLGRIYNKIMGFSVITRYLVYVVPIAFLIALPIVIYGTYKPTALFFNTGVRAELIWIWIEVVWLSIWISKLVSKCIPYLFVTLCGVISSGTRKYAAILHAVEIELSFVGWSFASIISFTALSNPGLNHQPHQKHWIHVVSNFLIAAHIVSFLFLAEKMFVQLISINYHRRSFDNRIKENKNFVRLLSLLYEASRTLFPTHCKEFAEEDYTINKSIINKLSKSRGNRSGSTTPLRLVGEIGRIGDKFTSAFGNIASEITGKQVFNQNSPQNVVTEALEKTRSAEALAKRLWMSFVLEDQDALHLDDIKEVLGPSRHDKAEDCFAVLDADENGDITLEEMITRVTELARDRKAVAASMRDVGQAIGVLNQVLVVVVSVISIFIFVAFQHTTFITTLATAGTTLLSLSFVFAATTQEFLGSCIFLFVKHPYDVGDRCDIDSTALVVEQISLLFTVFKRVDTLKLVQIPNMVLNTQWIENITRSKSMKEQLELFIAFDTPLDDIETLRTLMEAFVRSPDNSRDFRPNVVIEASSVNSMDKLSLRVEINYKSNWHNEAVRAARRSKLMCALVLALRKIPIYGPGGGGEALGGPKNPGYTVSVTDQWASDAREKAADDKRNKRLFPELLKVNEVKVTDTQFSTTADESPTEWNSLKEEVIDVRQETMMENMKIPSNANSSLLKRASTRGRRRHGEAVQTAPQQIYIPPTTEARNSNFQNTEHQNLDEEDQPGIYPSRNSEPAPDVVYSIYPNTSQLPPRRNLPYHNQQNQHPHQGISRPYKNEGEIC
ncbi:hypothetical protein K3495_g7373 [Podosphaera aphanis]|nr:hypothetical protein K3495_g7373 [Podosphaera aphanis]